jgi:site-specific DNA recombinase
MRAVAYVRVSTARQAEEGLSLEAQQRRVEAHIEGRGWKLVAPTFVERGVSGRRDDRPELARLLAAVDRGETDVVVIPALSRFGRSVRSLHTNFERLDRAGVALVSLTESIDTGTSVGRLLRSVLAALAEFESDVLGERVASVTAARAAKGKTHGRTPYGYRPGPGGIESDPVEAEIVRRVFRDYVAGGSMRTMAQKLNAERVPTETAAPGDNPRSEGAEQPRICRPGAARREGVRRPARAAAGPGAVGAGEGATREASARSDGGTGRVARHLLAYGLLRCPHCGGAMAAVTKPTATPGVQYERYACSSRVHRGLDSCPQVPLERGPIDTAVWTFFERAVLDVKATRAEIVRARSSKLAEVDALAYHAAREAQTARGRWTGCAVTIRTVGSNPTTGASSASSYRASSTVPLPNTSVLSSSVPALPMSWTPWMPTQSFWSA